MNELMIVLVAMNIVWLITYIIIFSILKKHLKMLIANKKLEESSLSIIVEKREEELERVKTKSKLIEKTLKQYARGVGDDK